MIHSCYRKILITLLAFVPLYVGGKEVPDTAFENLYQRFYMLYGQPEREKEFFEAARQMKDYYLKKGRKLAYYQIRQNEVLYDTEHGNIYRAITRSNEILEEMKKDDEKHYDIVYTALGTIYESRGNYRMADYYYKDALKNVEPNDTGALISIYSRLASLKVAREPLEAQKYNEKFGALSAKYLDYYKVYLALKGEIYFYLEDKKNFNQTYDKFTRFLKDHPGLDDYGVDVMKMANAAMNGNFAQAISLLGDDPTHSDDLRQLDQLGKVYEMMGRYDMALKASSRRRDLRDSLNSNLLFNNLNEVNAEMGLMRLSEQTAQEREEMVRKAAKEREMWLIVTIALLLVGIGLIVWRYLTRRAYQKRLLKQNKELEIALDHAQESDRMKTAFIEHVSHEIRTPLNVITGFAQVITNPDYQLDEEERNSMLNDISKNTIEITNIVNELLEVAEDESREHYQREDSVDVNQLCQEVMAQAAILNNGRLALQYKNLLDDGYLLRTNRQALTKILAQLMKNAVKFTDEGTVELKVRERAGNGGVEFTVTDTGIGIAQENQEKVFERFYKVDSFKQGLGLGLTMSRKMAELLDGSLQIDKSYQKGTRFILVLPS